LSSAEQEKSVVVIVRRPPLASERAAEALRLAVGQTLAANRVTVVFIDDGVWAASELQPKAVKGPDFAKPIQTLAMLEHRLVADAESLNARGIREVASGIEVKPREELLGFIRDADAVIPY
jgi:sulfur relay (sulfurtransferase) DsrF/TusC family protein